MALQVAIVGRNGPCGDKLEEAIDGCFGLGKHARRAVLSGLLPLDFDPAPQVLNEAFKESRIKDAFAESPHNPFIGRKHGNGLADASPWPQPSFGAAAVILVPAGLAGSHGHSAAAIAASQNAGQKMRRAGNSSRRFLGVQVAQAALDNLEQLSIDDGFDGHLDPLIARLGFLGPRIHRVEIMPPDVGLPGKDLMDELRGERLADAGPEAGGVEMEGELLGAQRSGAILSLGVKAEYPAHQLDLRGVDRQALLDALALLPRRHDPVTEGWPRAVPVSLPGVLFHGSQGVLRGLLGGVLVEKADDAAGEIAERIGPDVLRDGLEFDLVTPQSADIGFAERFVAKEPRQGMNHDDVKRSRGAGSVLDHGPELRPVVIARRCARLGVDAYQVPFMTLAVLSDLPLLVRQGEVRVCLPASRNSAIGSDTAHSIPPTLVVVSPQRRTGSRSRSLRSLWSLYDLGVFD